MADQICNRHIQAVMNNLKFIILDYLTAKKSGILDWRRDFCDWSLSGYSIWRVMHPNILQSTIRSGIMLYTSHASSTLMSRLKPWCGGVSSAWYAMPVCDAIIVSTISRMLPAVAAAVIIISNVRCWSWARMCCVRKLPNISWRSGSALTSLKIRITRYEEQILSGIGEHPDKPKIFIKKNVRNHSYHQFYPVLAKIRINRGLLYVNILDVVYIHTSW